MKIIKVKDCLNCPLSEHLGMYLYCGSSSGKIPENTRLGHLQNISNKTPIPKWCPLESD